MQEILVLIVEDDALIQMELESVLHDGGFSTISEARGDKAIATLEANASIKAIITDINLIGETSGWEVARRARELFPELRRSSRPSRNC